MGEGLARLAVQAAEPLVRVGAGLLAIVAADAELFVDQQEVGGLADAVVDEEGGDVRIKIDDAAEAVLMVLDIGGELLPRLHVGLEAAEQIGLLLEQLPE